ncbi:MAG: TolC family outer membrane protein [Alphaproteobacteria bacterium]
MSTRIKIGSLCLTVSALALLSLTPVQGYAQEEALHPSLSISLKDAVSTGLATNPEYGKVAANRRATDEELNQGRALYKPSIDMRAGAGPKYTDDDLDGSTSESETDFERQVSLTLTQLLFDGWETKYEVERQKARVNSTANRVRETAELVGLSIVESYLEVLRQRELLQIARQNVDAHVSIMDQIGGSVSAGRSTGADSEQAKARLAASRANEANVRQSLRVAEANYREEIGDAPGELAIPETPYAGLASDVEAEVEKTLSYSPTLDIFESDIEVAYAEAQQTKSTFYPQVDLQLSATEGRDVNNEQGRDRGASALVVMNWNLYRGGGDTARAREFVHRHQQSKESRTEAARSLESDVRSTWASMIASGERAKQFAAQADANTEVVKAYKDQFDLDRRTLLDVLDSQNELFVSRSATIDAEYLEMFAVYRLLALKGALLPVLGLEYPRESTIASDENWSYDAKMKAR